MKYGGQDACPYTTAFDSSWIVRTMCCCPKNPHHQWEKGATDVVTFRKAVAVLSRTICLWGTRARPQTRTADGDLFHSIDVSGPDNRSGSNRWNRNWPRDSGRASFGRWLSGYAE